MDHIDRKIEAYLKEGAETGRRRRSVSQIAIAIGHADSTVRRHLEEGRWSGLGRVVTSSGLGYRNVQLWQAVSEDTDLVYESNYDRQCGNRDGGYHCTVARGHAGNHAAHRSTGSFLRSWPNVSESSGRSQPYYKTVEGGDPCGNENETGPVRGKKCTARKGHGGDHTSHIVDGVRVNSTWDHTSHIVDGVRVNSTWTWPQGNSTDGVQPVARIGDALCGDRCPTRPLVCSAKLDHPGLHTAWGASVILATWGDVGRTYRPFHPRLCGARYGALDDCTCSEVCFDGTLGMMLEDGDKMPDAVDDPRSFQLVKGGS
jgi:hypothetical protein